MTDVPPFVTELGDEDARWLHGAGERRCVRAGEEIALEGFPPRHLFVVIEGEFEASSIAGGPVRAATDGVLLCIRREEVEAKLAGDPTFERRLDQVISKFAPRHRRQPGRLARKPLDAEPDIPAEFQIPQMIEKLLRGDI
ncbi:MAG TPA: cyclic nucleotide-binding domain-containing protein [Longimicrobium sp.]|nr:cyclic nucleotide-binding domain-containing protein [Longimicrobium sp.]